MKKALAIILSLVLVLGLFAACTKSSTTTSSPSATAAPASSEATASSAAPASASVVASGQGGWTTPSDPTAIPTDFTAKDYFGFFNPTLDYSKMKLKPYKFAFISFSWDDVMQIIANNFSTWANAYGSTCTSTSSDADAEKMVSNIELYAAQGYDGLLVNCFSEIMDRIVEVCAENNIKWWSVSEVPRGSDGVLNHPAVVNNDVAMGEDLIKQQVDWMKQNVEGFDPAKTMILIESLTSLSAFNDRNTGCENAWKKYLPEAKYEVADGLAEGGISAEIGYNMAATRFTANPDVKYWIYAATQELFATGSLRFVEEKGLDKCANIASIGCINFIKLLDNGTNGPWTFGLFSDMSISWNCCFNALYADVAGWCSFENLWPDVERLPGDKYPILNIGWVKYDKDTYKDYLAFSDAFTGLHNYPDYTWSGTKYPVLASEMT